MIRTGLLGCGRIGQVHGQNLAVNPGAMLVALYDEVAETAQNLAQKTGAEIRGSDEIIQADDIDAVLICTPTNTHYNLIHMAAEAKKAIFCEKPIDLSLARSQECVQVVERIGVPFMVAFNRRFDPNFAALQQRLQAGEAGEIELVNILSRDPAPPPLELMQSNGGLFQDMMIHDFDMARFLVGEEFVELYATGSVLVDQKIAAIDDIDTAGVILKAASGKICQISNSRRASYGYDQRVEVHGSKGMLRVDNLLENSVEAATKDGFHRAPTMHFFLERYQLAYSRELAHFIHSLNSGDAMTPNGQDGIQAQKLAEAATTSYHKGVGVNISDFL